MDLEFDGAPLVAWQIYSNFWIWVCCFFSVLSICSFISGVNVKKKRQTQKQQHQNTQLKTATAPIFWVKFVFLIERVILQIDRNENLIWFFMFTLRPLPNMAYFNIDYCTCQVKCMQQFQEPHWLRTRQFISYSAENWNKMQKLEIKLNYRSVANGERVSRK